MLDDKTNKEVQTNEVTVTSNVARGEKHGSGSNEARTTEEVGTGNAQAMGCVMLEERGEISRKKLEPAYGNQNGRAVKAEDDVTYCSANCNHIREENKTLYADHRDI
jgi:hypothetical protein